MDQNLTNVPVIDAPEIEYRSWAPEVIADASGKWIRSGLRFATEEEAKAQVSNLYSRWMDVKETRVTRSTDPVTAIWHKESGAEILPDAGPTTAN